MSSIISSHNYPGWRDFVRTQGMWLYRALVLFVSHYITYSPLTQHILYNIVADRLDVY